jgi:Flp pilus assembly pilin Flp
VRARDGRGAEAGARPTRRPSGPRGRLGEPDASGASSVEYGLLIALICGMLCVGVGVTLHQVFADTLSCFLAGIQGTSPTSCTPGPGDGGVGSDDGGRGRGDGGGIPMSSPSPTVSRTPSPTPAP